MTSLLTTLNGFSFTGAPARPAQQDSELEFQAVFAATTALLGGGITVILMALTQAF